MRELTYAKAMVEAFKEEMTRDERVFIMGEDVGRFGMIYVANPEPWKEFGDERVRDTPISENAIIGYALGAAMTGMRPIADIMFSDLLPLAMDQIVNQAAKVRYMFGGNIDVPLVILASVGGLRSVAAQHSQCLESWFAHVPGLKLALPSTPQDAKGLLKTAIRDNNPVMFFHHQQLLTSVGPVSDDEYLIPFGQADVKREGSDITIVTYSVMVEKALNVAKELANQGIESEIVDLRTLCPLDKKAILRSVKKTGRLLIVHQASLTCGFGAEIAAIVAEEAADDLICPIRRLGSLDVPIPYSPVMENYVVPTEEKIKTLIMKMLNE